MKNDSVLNAGILASYLLLAASVLIGVGMIYTGDTKDIPLMFGVTGLIGIAFLFVYGLITLKGAENSSNNHSDDYLSILELLHENPAKFNRNYKSLIGSGARYLTLLFINIFLGFIGIMAIGIKADRSIGGFGTLFAGLAVVVYIIIKSLYIKYEPAQGYVIDENNAYDIIKTINSAREKTGAPMIDKVLIGYDSNCGVSKNPLGFGFRSENLLYIGIYILIFLTKEELESILIHEYAHMYNKDTLVSNKIRRLIERWVKILENCENKGLIVNSLLKSFGINYIIKMQMYSLAVSKEQEIMADKEVAKFVNREIYAKTLIKVAMLDSYFINSIEDDSFDIRSLDEAPRDIFNIMTREYLKTLAIKKDEWKNQIVKTISNKGDTHPSYKERMMELGVINFDFDIDFVASNSPDITKIVGDLNSEWWENINESWKEYTDEYKSNKDIITNFKIDDDNDKTINYAMALEDLTKYSEALAVYNSILEKDPDYPPALFRSGLIYLAQNNEKGVELVRKAIELNSEYIESGLSSILAYFEENGLADKKEGLKAWANEKSELYDKKISEAETLFPNDIFVETNLTDSQRLELKEKLSTISSIKKVYIVSKKLKYSTDNLIVVAVKSKQGALNKALSGPKLLDLEKIEEILESLNITCFILDLEQNLQFLKAFKKINNSLLIDTES